LAQSKVIKQEFLKVAKQWETLAREIEDIERMRVFTVAAGRAQNPTTLGFGLMSYVDK
jgi:hypothetical protein